MRAASSPAREDDLVAIYFSAGELRALDDWFHDRGVVGSEQDQALESAWRKLGNGLQLAEAGKR